MVWVLELLLFESVVAVALGERVPSLLNLSDTTTDIAGALFEPFELEDAPLRLLCERREAWPEPPSRVPPIGESGHPGVWA